MKLWRPRERPFDRDPVEATKYAGVYFFAWERFIKIGSSADVEMRVRDFEQALPTDVERLGWIHLTEFWRLEENRIHMALKSRRVRGEWFHDTPDVRQFIAKYGKPWPA